MLDVDLAEIYGVPTKRLNEQVKRNATRFPKDFVFRLTRNEANRIFRSRSQFATLNRGQNIKYLPFVFTEHGAVMLASVLNSPVAVTASLQVVRAFVRLRELISEHDNLGRKISGLEQRIDGNSKDIGRIFEVLEDLIELPGSSRIRKIGFIP
jgi:phage regulator Rha-like protein